MCPEKSRYATHRGATPYKSSLKPCYPGSRVAAPQAPRATKKATDCPAWLLSSGGGSPAPSSSIVPPGSSAATDPSFSCSSSSSAFLTLPLSKPSPSPFPPLALSLPSSFQIPTLFLSSLLTYLCHRQPDLLPLLTQLYLLFLPLLALEAIRGELPILLG